MGRNQHALSDLSPEDTFNVENSLKGRFRNETSLEVCLSE